MYLQILRIKDVWRRYFSKPNRVTSLLHFSNDFQIIQEFEMHSNFTRNLMDRVLFDRSMCLRREIQFSMQSKSDFDRGEVCPQFFFRFNNRIGRNHFTRINQSNPDVWNVIFYGASCCTTASIIMLIDHRERLWKQSRKIQDFRCRVWKGNRNEDAQERFDGCLWILRYV